MKRILFFTIIIVPAILALSVQFAISENKYVNSKILSPNDLKPFLIQYHSRRGDKAEVKIHGIYQTGNSAQVFYQLFKVLGVNRSMYEESMNLIRFNSGKWFSGSANKFIVK